MIRYFVDSENVSSAWLAIIPTLEAKDHIYLMFSQHTADIRVSISQLLELSPFLALYSDQIEVVPCAKKVSPNGMDMELVSFMGFIIGSSRSKTAEYVIVSNDKGFDPVVEFWKSAGRSIQRYAIGQTYSDGQKFIKSKMKTAEKDVFIQAQPIVQDRLASSSEAIDNAEKRTHPTGQAMLPKNWVQNASKIIQDAVKVPKSYKKDSKRQNAYSRVKEIIPDSDMCMLLITFCWNNQPLDEVRMIQNVKSRLLRQLDLFGTKETQEYVEQEILPQTEKIVHAYKEA